MSRCINGLVPHYFRGHLEGRVLVGGVDTKTSTISALSRMAALLFQDPSSQLVNPTVFDEIAFGPENYGVPREEILRRVSESIESMRLNGYEERNPHSLSGGEQQACALAAIVSMRPEVYVLDEPTSNLDPIGSMRVLSHLSELSKSENATMIIVEHKLEELLDKVDRLIVMQRGRIVVEGDPHKMLEDAESLNKLGLKTPQTALLFSRLRKFDPTLKVPLTFDEAVAEISAFMKTHVKDVSAVKLGTAPPGPNTSKEGETIIHTEGLVHIYEAGTVALRRVIGDTTRRLPSHHWAEWLRKNDPREAFQRPAATNPRESHSLRIGCLTSDHSRVIDQGRILLPKSRSSNLHRQRKKGTGIWAKKSRATRR